MKLSRRRVFIFAGGLAVLGAGAWLALRGSGTAVAYTTAPVERGDIVDVVGATGTLQAVTTVQVGSQVSGTVESLAADFNSQVRNGQVVARLDPSLFDARLQQARANLTAAQANTERSRAAVEDARLKYDRAQKLHAEQLLPEADLETARTNHQAAVAQVRASQAAASQAVAAVRQAQVDLGHTVIKAPIDGVVVARNVDVGQTVAASLQAPVLFVIARDLSQMQVNASIDEADIGRVQAGQKVTFRVDAYPSETFTGRVEQVRLQPITVQNVVTYNTIIGVDNPGGRLMPGMTATVSVVIQERPDALRLPATALRFRPEGFEAGRRRAGGEAGTGASPAAPGGAAGDVRAAGNGTGQRGAGPGGRGRGRRGQDGADGQATTVAAGAPEVDGAPRPRARPAVVFVPGPDGKPQPRPIRVGISDGQFVEVADGLQEGERVITGAGGDASRAGSPRPGGSPGAATNPFAPQQGQRRQR
jgi:HlyD family secretion protein